MPTTTAAVLRSPDAPFALETLDLDEPRPGEALVGLVASGMCHTDLSMREPFRPTPYPVVLGHEGSGRIEAVGPGVTDLEVGQPVVLSYTSCGRCRFCLRGEPNYCQSIWALNTPCCRPDGSTALADEAGPVGSHFFGQSSFATHAVVPRSSIVPVTDDAPLELLGPLGCGVQTGAGAVLNVLGPEPGDSLVVFGCGAVGLSAVLAATVAGCDPIIGVDIHDSRLETAARLGATHTINGGHDDLVAALLDVSPGGVDYSFDAAGAPSTLEAAVECLAHRGTCGFVAAGGPDHTVKISPRHLLSGRTITGILEGDSVSPVFIPQLIELHRRGRFPFDELITTYPLADINEAEAASRSGDVFKPVLLMP
ncbi:MAG: NAD(P)-dependent alcohol dehydrogenase [Acidimicrobiia bacterium]|nr:NAD(P)-dependent alcohol dehydrogenase [Acidimicrobiia bacterium]